MSAAPLLEAKDLTRHYAVRRGVFAGKATLSALDGVSFAVGDSLVRRHASLGGAETGA